MAGGKFPEEEKEAIDDIKRTDRFTQCRSTGAKKSEMISLKGF